MEMWAIKVLEADQIMPHSVRRTRREAIEAVVAPPRLPWKVLYRKGCRAVRVRVEDTSNDVKLAA